MKITDLKQQVKDKSRISVYVDGKFSFGLTLAQVSDFGLKKGLEIGEDQIEIFKNEAEYGKEKSKAVNYCLLRERSTKELRDYLWRRSIKKNIPKSFESRILQELAEKNIVDDERFTKLWVENRKKSGGISLKKLKLELMKKGISQDLIEKITKEVFGDGGERNEREEIQKVLAKKAKKYAGDKQKLMQYLAGQGFGYDLIKEATSETTD